VRRAALLLAGAFLIAGCGANSATKNAAITSAQPKDARHLAAYVRSSVTKSSAETSRLEFEVKMDSVPEVGNLSIKGKGDYDPAQKRGHFELGAAGQDIEEVFDNRIVYVKGAGLPGDRWLKLDVDALAANTKLPAELAAGVKQLRASLDQADPRQAYEYLRSVDNVKTVGDEELRGVATTHYRGSEDFTKQLDTMTEESSRLFARYFGYDVLASVPVDVWMDDRGRVRRIEATFQADPAKMEMTFEQFDYGAPVAVSVPSGSDVVDVATLLGGTS